MTKLELFLVYSNVQHVAYFFLDNVSVIKDYVNFILNFYHPKSSADAWTAFDDRDPQSHGSIS